MKAVFALTLLTAISAYAQTPPAAPAAKLPVRRVVLYKNGVGYFEHTGRVRGNQELTIDFTSAQLNDALKSLTLIDEGEGKITGVRYNSATPLEQQLRTLHVSLGQNVTYSDLLNSLRGSRVEVRDKAVLTIGRVLSVEDRIVARTASDDPADAKQPVPVTRTWMTLVSDSGEVRSFVVDPALQIKPLEGEMREDLGRYLQMLAAARAQDLRRMTVSTQGQGEREIFVSYISEVPVWKTSYRILLSPDTAKPALLQGWAIVDNTVGEDWNNVELSLVSGAPQSFVQNLSQPYYQRRPEVGLPQTAMLTPQTHEGTIAAEQETQPQSGVVGGVPGGVAGGAIGALVRNGPPAASAGSIIADRLQGFGSGAGKGPGSGAGFGGGVYPAAMPAPPAINLYETVTETMNRLDSASANELGGLFEYKLKDRVSIAKNQSALVPIVNARVEAEHVTLWNANESAPLRAIWLKNTSGATLDGGSFNIIDGNAFAGEGVFGTVHPNEKRLLSYAVDDAVRVVREGERERKPLRHIKIVNGIMIETTEEREATTYTVRNADSRAREVILEHPKQQDWKLVSETQPEETTASLQRFRLKIAPASNATLKVEMLHPLETRVLLSDMNEQRLAMLLDHSGANNQLTPQLRKVLDQKSALAAVDIRLSNLRARIAEIQQDQQRLRENMKALKGSAEERALLQRYTGELNAQEDELASIKKQISNTEQEREKARELLADTIASTAFDGDLGI